MLDDDGAWGLAGPLEASPVLREQLGRRLGVLDQQGSSLVAALAIAEMMRLAVVERLAPLSDLAALEEQGLIVIDTASEPVVRLAHPLYGEVMRAITPTARLHEARRRIAAALLEAEPRRDDETVLAATLSLESGRIDGPLLFDAAQVSLAKFDASMALKLTTALLTVDGSPPARLTHARALSAAGLGAEAGAELDALARLDLGDEWLVGVTLVHAQDLMFRAAGPDDAITLLRERIDALPLDQQVPLRSFLGWVAFFTGALDESLAAVEPVLDLEQAPLAAMQGAQSVASIVGQPQRVIELVDRVLRVLERDGLPAGTGVATLGNFFFGRLLALWQLGRATEGDDPFGPARHLGLTQLDAPQFAAGMSAPQQFIRGHLDRAAAECDEVADIMWQFEMPVWTYNLTLGALTEAMRGNLPVARARLAEVDSTPPAHRLVFRSWVERARLWITSAEGDVDAAVAASLAIADQHAQEHFHATISLHDVVRFGRADLVVDRLEAQAARPGATWWDRVCHDHARAVVQEDSAILLAVADRFEAGGLDLHAAEALAQSVEFLEARRAACRNARTPGDGPGSLRRRTDAGTPAGAVSTQRARGPGGPTRRRGSVQPRDRRPAGYVCPYRRQPAPARVRQARSPRSSRAPRCDHRLEHDQTPLDRVPTPLRRGHSIGSRCR